MRLEKQWSTNLLAYCFDLWKNALLIRAFNRNQHLRRYFILSTNLAIFKQMPFISQPSPACTYQISLKLLLRLRETRNALQLPVILLVVFLPALSGVSGNSEQKTILQITKQLIQYTDLEIQFRSLKYASVLRIRKRQRHMLTT